MCGQPAISLSPSAERRLMIHTEQTVVRMHPCSIITSSCWCLFWVHPGVHYILARVNKQNRWMTQAAAVLINPLKIIYYSFVLWIIKIATQGKCKHAPESREGSKFELSLSSVLTMRCLQQQQPLRLACGDYSWDLLDVIPCHLKSN